MIRMKGQTFFISFFYNCLCVVLHVCKQHDSSLIYISVPLTISAMKVSPNEVSPDKVDSIENVEGG